MTVQVQHPVVEWYLAFDDIWELMRVNWHTHNPFTQSGMWDVEGATIKGIVLVVDTTPYRGVVLRVDNQGEDDYVAIATYGPKCQECGYQPYNALWFGDGEGDAVAWGAKTISDMIFNAEATGVDRRHNDECSHLVYPDETALDEVDGDD